MMLANRWQRRATYNFVKKWPKSHRAQIQSRSTFYLRRPTGIRLGFTDVRVFSLGWISSRRQHHTGCGNQTDAPRSPSNTDSEDNENSEDFEYSDGDDCIEYYESSEYDGDYFNSTHEDGFEYDEAYYCKGFCPVHLGEVFDGRFEVVYKLAAGNSSTTWLARDIHHEQSKSSQPFVALNFERALSSASSPSLRTSPEVIYSALNSTLSTFRHSSPQGSHVVRVTPLVRPLHDYEFWMTLDEIEGVTMQLIHGVAQLHSQGLVHGGIHPYLIMYHCKPMTEAIFRTLPKPERYSVPDRAYVKAGGRVPRYLVSRRGWEDAAYINSVYDVPGRDSWVAPQISLLEMNTVFPSNTSLLLPKLSEIGVDEVYTPPEYVSPGTHRSYGSRRYGDIRTALGNVVEKADIWALGLTCYELLTPGPLFYRGPLTAGKFLQIDPKAKDNWWQKQPIPVGPILESGHQSTPEFWAEAAQALYKKHRIDWPMGSDRDTQQVAKRIERLIRLVRYMLIFDPRSRPSAVQVIDFWNQQS